VRPLEGKKQEPRSHERGQGLTTRKEESSGGWKVDNVYIRKDLEISFQTAKCRHVDHFVELKRESARRMGDAAAFDYGRRTCGQHSQTKRETHFWRRNSERWATLKKSVNGSLAQMYMMKSEKSRENV